MKATGNQARILSDALKVFFWNALRVAVTNPAQAYSFFRTVRWQTRAARLRSSWKKKGINVPPILIFSITNRCNLECKGCYALALQDSAGEELSDDKLRAIVTEAAELGVSFFVLAGGEPFLRPEILDIIADFPRIIFLVFTNGLLVDEAIISRLKAQKNIVSMISLEGDEQETDRVRGKGIFQKVEEVTTKLKKEKIFFGTSLTLTRSTFDTITGDRFIGRLAASGCRFFLFLEYTAVSDDTVDWTLTDEQRNGVRDLIETFRKRYKALFIGVPWDEDDVGGCLAAGRGFVHVNASGDVEPCPFAPFSDTNLRDRSLVEGLQSELLLKLRQRPELLKETGGGCGLWKNREHVEAILKNIKGDTGESDGDASAVAVEATDGGSVGTVENE
jgi:MoaA/NifB/PqqE/SkfB family radical SAM enzyme